MRKELNSALFAFFKNPPSMSKTDSSHLSDSGTVINLTRLTVPDVFFKKNCTVLYSMAQKGPMVDQQP